MNENAKETAQESTDEIAQERKVRIVKRCCNNCVYLMRRTSLGVIDPDGDTHSLCPKALKLEKKKLTLICPEFLMNPHPGCIYADKEDLAYIRAGKDPDEEWGKERRRRMEYLHPDTPLGEQETVIHKRVVPKVPRFEFDVRKNLWICTKCSFVCTRKNTMKSHFKRKHQELPDMAIAMNPPGESPQPDRKVDGRDPWEVG